MMPDRLGHFVHFGHVDVHDIPVVSLGPIAGVDDVLPHIEDAPLTKAFASREAALGVDERLKDLRVRRLACVLLDQVAHVVPDDVLRIKKSPSHRLGLKFIL